MDCRRAVALISSGIDSPVAAWMMKNKGVDIVGVHCSNEPLAPPGSGDVTRRMCVQIGVRRLYIVKHGALVQKNLKDRCEDSMVCVLCKRFMMRVAEAIARKEGCCCIVTGENLGQVASQTLDNMVVVTDTANIPVLRPILCNDKQETVDIARKIGTYDIGLETPPACTIVPKHPATKAVISKAECEESKLDVASIVEEVVDTAEILDL